MIDNYPLILDRKGTTLQLRDGQLSVRLNNRHLQSVPIELINLIIIATPVTASTTLWHTLAQAEITTVILPTRGRAQPAWITNSLAPGTTLRHRQYHLANSTAQPELAWYWIEQKLHAQRHTLRILDCPLGPLETIRKPATLTLDTILGTEGAAARHYFSQLATRIPETWHFTGRNRNPPRDPFNSLLSLSYTLLTTEALHVVSALGFDPWLGFLHQTYPARPSLALDLVEPFRPQIDLWCLYLATEILDPKTHFVCPRDREEATLLNKEGRTLYFQQWSVDRQNWKEDKSLMQLLMQSARSFKATLQDLSLENFPLKGPPF